jgi:hypothetical protein
VKRPATGHRLGIRRAGRRRGRPLNCGMAGQPTWMVSRGSKTRRQTISVVARHGEIDGDALAEATRSRRPPPLLARFDLCGVVVTAEAKRTRRRTAKTIAAAADHYRSRPDYATALLK